MLSDFCGWKDLQSNNDRKRMHCLMDFYHKLLFEAYLFICIIILMCESNRPLKDWY